MRKTTSLALLFLVGILFVVNLYAADRPPPGSLMPESVDWQRECQSVKDLKPSKRDIPSPELLKSMIDCDADDMYYDAKNNIKSTKEDWSKVRACAWAKDNNQVLMMLYANGFGVQRDYFLATKYACLGNDVSIDPRYVVEGIYRIRHSDERRGEMLDVCDFESSTISSGYCAALRENQKDRGRNRRLDEIGKVMTPQQKQEFEKLRLAVHDLADARAKNETDMSGSGRAMSATGSSADVLDEFLADVEHFEKGGFPSYTPGQFHEYDRQLNEVYRKIMNAKIEGDAKPIVPTGITKSSIKETEKFWIRYRDAWVAFGKVRNPAVSEHALKAMLTERRIRQLEELQGAPGMPLISE